MSQIVDSSRIINVAAQAANLSAILDCSELDVLSIQLVSTAQSGSSVIALYESVDGKNFIAVSGLTETVTTSNTNVIWHIQPVYSRYYKVLFTYGSGACTFSVSINARNNTILSGGSTVPVTLGVA